MLSPAANNRIHHRQVALLLLQFPAAGSLRALLLGALGLAGLRTGALPRPLAIAALAAAGVNALAPPVLAFQRAALVMPAGRFPSFVIMRIAGFRLARGPRGS